MVRAFHQPRILCMVLLAHGGFSSRCGAQRVFRTFQSCLLWRQVIRFHQFRIFDDATSKFHRLLQQPPALHDVLELCLNPNTAINRQPHNFLLSY